MWYVDFILALQSLQFSSGSQDESRITLASSSVFKSASFLFIHPPKMRICVLGWEL